MMLWIQQWEESERGWSTRPDGFTAHLKKEDIDKFLKEMRAEEKKSIGDSVPDCYSRPCGEPFEHEIPEKMLKVSIGSGTWLPHDWRPDKKTDKARDGGWKSLAKT